MMSRRVGSVAVGLWLAAGPGCQPRESATATSATGSTGPTTTEATASTTGTGATTGAPTGGPDSSTGAPVECMNVLVPPGGPRTCVGEELVIDGACEQPAGYELCDDGSTHRHTAVACNAPDPRVQCPRVDDDPVCVVNSECDEFPGGVCSEIFAGFCACDYHCSEDDDCGAGGACVCSVRRPSDDPKPQPFYNLAQCVPAQCRIDADCGEFRCGVSVHPCRWPEGLYCHTAEDECEGHEDCPEITSRCAYSPEEMRWTCGKFAACE